VQISRDASGGETVLGLAGPGEIVDPAGAVCGWSHHFDAFAAIDCALLGVPRDDFRDALGSDPLLSLTLAHMLAEKMRWVSDTAHERAAHRVSGRVAGRLLELARLLGRERGGAIEMYLPIDQTTFARLAGTSRESVCKTLRRFKADGVVDYEGRRLRILRPDALTHLRCAGRRG
jgi:CRP-like cAMP-binding protein